MHEMRCANGHAVRIIRPQAGGKCDLCNGELDGPIAVRCVEGPQGCDWDACARCVKRFEDGEETLADLYRLRFQQCHFRVECGLSPMCHSVPTWSENQQCHVLPQNGIVDTSHCPPEWMEQRWKLQLNAKAYYSDCRSFEYNHDLLHGHVVNTPEDLRLAKAKAEKDPMLITLTLKSLTGKTVEIQVLPDSTVDHLFLMASREFDIDVAVHENGLRLFASRSVYMPLVLNVHGKRISNTISGDLISDEKYGIQPGTLVHVYFTTRGGGGDIPFDKSMAFDRDDVSNKNYNRPKRDVSLGRPSYAFPSTYDEWRYARNAIRRFPTYEDEPKLDTHLHVRGAMVIAFVGATCKRLHAKCRDDVLPQGLGWSERARAVLPAFVKGWEVEKVRNRGVLERREYVAVEEVKV